MTILGPQANAGDVQVKIQHGLCFLKMQEKATRQVDQFIGTNSHPRDQVRKAKCGILMLHTGILQTLNSYFL